ncbi:hypothetical protein [Tolypothrix sp. VBCCA 56010]|uniref:hypothetical protein n=1 Tax=Tolypothrix sp. VBCCA 56010 TaxID=3137731 RepID=UPI003D7DB2A7
MGEAVRSWGLPKWSTCRHGAWGMGEAVRSWGLPKWSTCRHGAWGIGKRFDFILTFPLPIAHCPLPIAQFPNSICVFCNQCETFGFVNSLH